LPKRVGIVLTGRRAAREGASLIDQDNRIVGTVTSGSFSPTLDKPVAMGYVSSAVSQPRTALDVDIRGTRVAASVTLLPFYKRP
jgi:aminomethyltransferase